MQAQGTSACPPSHPPNPWPIHLQWGFPGWPHDTLHDITCLLIIALQSATRQQRRMGLVTEALAEWLCPAVPCRVPPPSPSPSLVPLLPRKRRQHTPGAFSLPLSSTRIPFFQVCFNEISVDIRASRCYSQASSAGPLWPSCSFNTG